MNYPVNPSQIIQMIKSGKNPQQLLMNILQGQMGNTPFGQNLLKLAQNNQTKDIEQIVRNVCQQRGVDFDKEFDAFRKQYGI